jgi:hypothetical protein
MPSLRESWLSVRAIIGWLPIIMLGTLLVIVLLTIFLWGLDFWKPKALLQPERGLAIPNEEISEELNDKQRGIVAAGAITDLQGKAIPGAVVKLSAYTGDGKLVWSTNAQTDDTGKFTFRKSEIPPVTDLFAAVITAEAPGFLAEKKNVTVQARDLSSNQNGQGVQQPANQTPSQQTRELIVTPALNRMSLVPYNLWLTIIVMVPAIFGILFAILHLTRLSLGIWVTYWYTFGTAALWCLVSAELILVYVVHGQALIPLFWPDLFISSGVVIFAFLGSVVYVAFSMHEKKGSFFDAELATKRKILLTLGGRVLVAPYIALTAYGIMAATFPEIRTGAFAAFFGFFTGLWIKVVLEMLNDIGTRFLSAESAQKVADRLKRTEVPDAPQLQGSSASGMKPDQAFLDAVSEARKELLQKENVIGVAPGFKLLNAGTSTPQKAIIVYVIEKTESVDETNRVPDTYRGFPTDVFALPAAGPFETTCRSVMSILSWGKIHTINDQRIKSLVPQPRTVTASRVDTTEIILLLDPDESLFNRGQSEQTMIFDVIGAHIAIRGIVGDRFDFVSFAIDKASGLPKVGDYHVPVFSDIEGINYKREGNPGSAAQPNAWEIVRTSSSDTTLRACFVRSENPDISFYRYLHELGHYWCAYVTFKESAQSSVDSQELLNISDPRQGQYHWDLFFDNGRSPVDYDMVAWQQIGDGSFKEEFVDDAKCKFKYCNLDLYLMGLIPKDRVGTISILRNPQFSGTFPNRVLSATPFKITVDDIIRSCGERSPAFGRAPKRFKQAMVVVSKDQSLGETYARNLEAFRKDYEEDFKNATDDIALLDTRITHTA